MSQSCYSGPGTPTSRGTPSRLTPSRGTPSSGTPSSGTPLYAIELCGVTALIDIYFSSPMTYSFVRSI